MTLNEVKLELDRIEENPDNFEFTSYSEEEDRCRGCGSFGPFLHNKEESFEVCLRCDYVHHY